MSLNSGERQTSGLYASIRLDHRARYEWADARLPADTFGLDVFCGNGYGTQLLSHCRNVLGIDGSVEAIAFAGQHYSTPRNFFASKYWPFSLPRGTFDFIVSLESIERVPDPERFFGQLCEALKPKGQLIFSVPNQACLPFDAKVHVFHKRHFLFHDHAGHDERERTRSGGACGAECLPDERGKTGTAPARRRTGPA